MPEQFPLVLFIRMHALLLLHFHISFPCNAHIYNFVSKKETLVKRGSLFCLSYCYLECSACLLLYFHSGVTRYFVVCVGVQIYCAPTADSRDSWLSTMRHIAMEGRCFVLGCNQFLRKSDYPSNFPSVYDGKPDDFVVCRGGSCIVNPLGEVIAGPNYDGEDILLAELDMDDIIRGKFDFDATGHYGRPDVFRVTVNEQETKAVVVTNKGITSVASSREGQGDS